MKNEINCFECGKSEQVKNMFRWYHGDQDDLVCESCAKKLKHTDTGMRGLSVYDIERN